MNRVGRAFIVSPKFQKPAAKVIRYAIVASVLSALAFGLSVTAPAWAHGSEDTHRLETIEQHREMARLHTQAADCMAGGQTESHCHEQLRTACRGLGLGQYCGLRHAH